MKILFLGCYLELVVINSKQSILSKIVLTINYNNNNNNNNNNKKKKKKKKKRRRKKSSTHINRIGCKVLCFFMTGESQKYVAWARATNLSHAPQI